jgi:tetratricopeptide (TPR) repeat protein
METKNVGRHEDVRPYVVRTYDRWIILAVVITVGWFLFRPIFGYTVYYRGLSFERMLNIGVAKQYYAKSTRVYPNLVEPWLALAILQSMDGRVNHTDYEAALSTLDAGLSHNPQSGALAFQLCRDKYEIGRDYSGAFAACSRSVANDPANKFAWDYGAWAAHRLGADKIAASYWRRVLLLDPKYAAAARALGYPDRAPPPAAARG